MIIVIAEAASLTYNGETRRLFVGLNNGTISVSICIKSSYNVPWFLTVNVKVC